VCAFCLWHPCVLQEMTSEFIAHSVSVTIVAEYLLCSQQEEIYLCEETMSIWVIIRSYHGSC